MPNSYNTFRITTEVILDKTILDADVSDTADISRSKMKLTDDLVLSSPARLGISCVPTVPFEINGTFAPLVILWLNDNADLDGASSFVYGQDGATKCVMFNYLNSGYMEFEPYYANSLLIEAQADVSNGITLNTINANAPIRLYTNNTKRLTVGADGYVNIEVGLAGNVLGQISCIARNM
jgi:hypothetical protein